jgi:hypothetical protein
MTIGLTFLSCQKDENIAPTMSTLSDLNGEWLKGEWRSMYTNGDSIIATGNWTFHDSVVDVLGGRTNYLYNHNTDSQLRFRTNSVNDTSYINGEYVGDGICCNPSFVSTSGQTYTTGNSVTINGKSYKIIDHLTEGTGLNDEYHYYIQLMIAQPYEGCNDYYELFKKK